MGSAEGGQEAAAETVSVPAIAVVATGALWLLVWLAGAAYTMTGIVKGAPAPLESTPPALNLVAQLLFAAVAVLVIVGGMQMRRLRHYGMAMTAAILSLLCGCLPLAIWAIIVLLREDVRAAFERP